MVVKRLVCPARRRQLPAQFSWIDQRLVREHYLERCGCEALALYLFLITVADAEGLSYYGDAALGRALTLSPERLAHARAGLIRADLIAHRRPLYQVLSLEPPAGHRPDALKDALARLRTALVVPP